MAGTRENLWAPWRMEMIRAPKPEGCFLCAHPAGKDEDHLILERGRSCYCLLNLYPYNNGHLMVAPFRHTGDLTGLSDEELAEMMAMAREWVRDLRTVMRPDGFNLGLNLGTAGGAGVADHLHMHVVPRWSGDTNFMTLFGETRVINQALQEAWRELRAARAAREA